MPGLPGRAGTSADRAGTALQGCGVVCERLCGQEQCACSGERKEHNNGRSSSGSLRGRRLRGLPGGSGCDDDCQFKQIENAVV